ncbi:hypothetical protein HDU87_002371 [Geranomyces variabilis]|uniref:4-alpha-glucanotransferase n=1 Tax=Geranomyces variabilis TaxID=109894 RepID=A0AAD5TL62_9FUNG|nr:hypothetical protein HDU87_002371 [Geranomyces variabilis]
MLAALPGRSSGVLLHVTSLPSAHGVGDVGTEALRFLDWMHKAGQTLWQFLPLNPHGHAGSPYGTPSALAANPILISLEPLVTVGLLKNEELKELLALPKDKVDYDRVTPMKRRLLRIARDRFRDNNEETEGDAATKTSTETADTKVPATILSEWADRFDQFVLREGPTWLDDYALFTALREHHGKCWVDWPADVRDRKAPAMKRARKDLAAEIDEHMFNQFLFDLQWTQVRARARELGIKLVGDIPIFVAYDSADVWSHRQMFKLDVDGKQLAQAGVPPDYFSATGQLWGNPVYDWAAIAKDDYKWWTLRCRRTLALTDVIRIDHFRGFEAAWEVPAADTTAMNGKWVKGPGAKVFKAVDKALGGKMPVIAEDLGVITAEVEAVRDEMGYPGMKVLQFAWGGGSPYNPRGDHLPHNLRGRHCVYYTGTHDNNTARGWAEQATPAERRAVRRYVGRAAPGAHSVDEAPAAKRKRVNDGAVNVSAPAGGSAAIKSDTPADDGDDAKDVIDTASMDFIRLALASVADMAIFQLQDALDLGTDCRMNLPATAEGNWGWRALDGQMTDGIAAQLRNITEFYGRI